MITSFIGAGSDDNITIEIDDDNDRDPSTKDESLRSNIDNSVKCDAVIGITSDIINSPVKEGKIDVIRLNSCACTVVKEF